MYDSGQDMEDGGGGGGFHDVDPNSIFQAFFGGGAGGMGGMGGMQQPGMGMGMGGMMPGQGMGGMPGMSQPQQSQAPPAPVAVAGVQPSVVPPAQEKVTLFLMLLPS